MIIQKNPSKVFIYMFMIQNMKTFEGLFNKKPKQEWLESEPETLGEIMDKFGRLTWNYPFIHLLDYLKNTYANKKVKLVSTTGKNRTFDVKDIIITLKMYNGIPDFYIKFICYGVNIQINDPEVEFTYLYKETPVGLKDIDPFNEEDWSK